MSKVDRIIIDFSNMDDAQQIKLWLSLFNFADKDLPEDTELRCFVVKNRPK